MRNTSALQMILLLLFLTIRATLQSSIDSDHHQGIMREPDCSDIAAYSFGSSAAQSGKYHLIVGEGRRGVWAYCDMETDGGGWTVIQRRTGPEVSFYRTWDEYHKGFGDPEGDYWLGNTYIHSLTVNKRYILRIDFTDWENKTYYAEYNNFVLGGAGCKYKLESVGEFCGDCGDSLTYHVGQKFTTFDQDYDTHATSNCAQLFKGAWWYRACHGSNLNGLYKPGGRHDSYADGINWGHGKGYHYSYMKSEMKIRPYKY